MKDHTSVDEYKRSQFRKYATLLEETQKSYAHQVGAEYHLFRSDERYYIQLQFDKIRKLEELTKDYDEVLYLDFDVVPRTSISFFDYFNLNNICAHALMRDPTPKQIRNRIRDNNWHHMDVYTKTCAKKAMLLLYEINGKENLINTAVLGANKNAMDKLAFSENFQLCVDAFEEALIDNVYPAELYEKWVPNNEVFLSFLIEKNKVPHHDIGMQWNFCLDYMYPTPTPGCHFLHHVNKEFELSFNGNL